MLVTVLMVNDDGDIIRECLEDRIANFDLIAIEDSSHDNTPEVCKEFLAKYPDKILYRWDDTPLTIKYHRSQLYKMLIDHGVDDKTWIWQMDTDIFFNGTKENMIQTLNIADEEQANCIVCKIAQFYPTFEDLQQPYTYWKDFQYFSMNWRSKILYNGISKLFFRTDDQETPSVPDEKKSSFSPTVKHYQYRSVAQIQKKVERAYKVRSYSHIISPHWEDYIIDKEFLSKWEDNSHRRPHHCWRSLVSLTKEKNGQKIP